MQTQMIPFPLQSVSYSASGRASVDLSVIPAAMAGRAVAVAQLTFDVQATPTLGAGTATAAELQALVRNVSIRDSVRSHFDGSFTSLRLSEAYERGQLWSPEPDAAATTEAVNFQRVFTFGLAGFCKESDFFLSAAALGQGSSIELSFGALTDIDAQCTALSATVQPVAWLVLRDDVIISPLLERVERVINKDVPITGEALYANLALADSSTFGAITAGDFANITIQSAGVQTKQVSVHALKRAYFEHNKVGSISQFDGEPRAATDDNQKTVAGTALAAVPANLQPVIWSCPGQKITKLAYAAQNELVIGWSGTQAAGYGLISRIIKRTKDIEEAYVATMQQKLGARLREFRIDTASKSPYPAAGPRARYMPVKAKF